MLGLAKSPWMAPVTTKYPPFEPSIFGGRQSPRLKNFLLLTWLKVTILIVYKKYHSDGSKAFYVCLTYFNFIFTNLLNYLIFLLSTSRENRFKNDIFCKVGCLTAKFSSDFQHLKPTIYLIKTLDSMHDSPQKDVLLKM